MRLPLSIWLLFNSVACLDRINAKRWDGTAWMPHGQDGTEDVLGALLPAGAVVDEVATAIAGDRLCVAWNRDIETTPDYDTTIEVSCTQ